LDSLIVQLVHKDIIWKMSFSSKSDNDEMNVECSDGTHNNNDFFNYAFAIDDYDNDYLKETVNMRMPVLFFYGEKDWCVGPEHYKRVNFPNMKYDFMEE
jgi:proline iminopeptidase